MKWEQTYATVEDERIRNHLENTEVQMRKVDCSNMSNEMKQAREEKIKLLHEYWMMGKFPINTEYPMKRLPHIKDEFGTPCAMAYIIEESGDRQLVEELQETNNVFIKDVNDGKLIDWIITSGITKEEACQIQPTYAMGRCADKDGKVINFQMFNPFGKPKNCVKDLPALPLPFCPESDRGFAFNCQPRTKKKNGNGRTPPRIRPINDRRSRGFSLKDRVLARRKKIQLQKSKSFKETLAIRQARKKESAKSRRTR